jgi:hypothetical protein
MSLIRPATQLWLHSDTAHSLEPLLTLVRSQRLQLPGADQRTGQVQECGEEVSALLVANREAPVGRNHASDRSTSTVAPSRMLDSTPRPAIRGQIPRRRKTVRQLG